MTVEYAYSANRCNDLFSSTIPKNTSEFIATERLQVRSLVQELTIRIKNTSIDADLLERLSTLDRNLDDKVELESFRLKAREIIEIVHEYNVRLAKRRGAKNLDIMALDVLFGGFLSAQNDIQNLEIFLKKRGVTDLQYLESATNLSVRGLLDYLSNGFFAIGISINPVPADGMLMKPPGFYLHDVGHAERFTIALKLIAENRNLAFSQVWNLFKERLSGILVRIDQIQDPMMREQLEWLVFYEAHETRGPNQIGSFIFDKDVSVETKSEFYKEFRLTAGKEMKTKVKENGHSWKKVFATYVTLKQSLTL